MGSTDFSKGSSRGAGFLFFLAFALVAAGAAFAFAPHYSWQVTKVARQASALGLENGLLVLSGLLFFGLGVIARSSGGSTQVHDPRPEIEAVQSEVTLLNEQFSTKLAQIRTSLLQVRESLGQVAAQVEAQVQAQGQQKPETTDHSRDAVFRLAASLDKLHAHLDEKVHSVDLQMRSGFESLLSASQEVQRMLAQGGLGAIDQGGQVAQEVEFGIDLPETPPPAPVQPDEPASIGGIDLYETMQKLDAISGEIEEPAPPLPSFDGPAGYSHEHHEPQGHGQSLDDLLPEEYRDRY